MRSRRPVVAGQFYPWDPADLARTVDELLASAPRADRKGLRVLVAPHAGYQFSGPVAARAFRLLPRRAAVLLLGPSHFVPLDGMAVSGADVWATPLGEVPVAAALREAAVHAGATVDDGPHAHEHALEVELPFLQRACTDGLEILPVAVGRATAGDVAMLIAALDVLTLVSTDLSHYHDHATARRLDRETAEAVLALAPEGIGTDRACGSYALRGAVEHARRTGLAVELLDLRTSADTAGDAGRVVGYGAFAAYEVGAAAASGVAVTAGESGLRMSSAQSLSFATRPRTSSSS